MRMLPQLYKKWDLFCVETARKGCNPVLVLSFGLRPSQQAKVVNDQEMF